MHEMPSKSIDVGYKAHNNALTEFGKTLYRPPPLVGIRMKKIREPQLFIIRNKYTKEVVDLEYAEKKGKQKKRLRRFMDIDNFKTLHSG